MEEFKVEGQAGIAKEKADTFIEIACYMLLAPVWTLIEERVFSVPSTPKLFNLYRDRHAELDRSEAPEIRRRNLRRYLACYERLPAFFMLAEAPGPWGCRFSGVPFTSEAQLLDEQFPIDGQPSSRLEEAPHTEYSGGIFWRVMQPYFPRFFVWNSLPFHPHDDGEPLSIRAPRRSELKRYSDLLAALLEFMQPDQILAAGRKAEYALKHIGADCTYVRHPSQGGARKFETGVQAAFGEDICD